MKKYKILDTTDNKYIGSTALVDDTYRICYIGNPVIQLEFDSLVDDGTKIRLISSNYQITLEK